MKTKVELVRWADEKYSIRFKRKSFWFGINSTKYLDLKAYPQYFYEWGSSSKFFGTECIGNKEEVEQIYNILSRGGTEGEIVKTSWIK